MINSLVNSTSPHKLIGGEFPETNDHNDQLPAICGFDYFAATGWVYDEKEVNDSHGESETMKIPNLERTLGYLRDIVKGYWPDSADHVDESSHPIIGYNSAQSWYGGRLKISWHTESMTQRVYFGATGSVLELLDPAQQADLVLSVCGHFGFRPTRLDVYFRDFDIKLKPSQLWAWAEAGYLCRFKSKSYEYRSKGPNGKAGQTFYAGSRGKKGGEMFLRVYDERVEPSSPAPAIKYECEYSGHKVRNLVARFLSLPYSDGDFLKFCLESTIGPGVIDFKMGDREKAALRDLERVSEWDDFILGTATVRIQGKPKKPEIDGFPLVAFVQQWGKKLYKTTLDDPRFKIRAFLDFIGQIDCALMPILASALASGERRLNMSKTKKSLLTA